MKFPVIDAINEARRTGTRLPMGTYDSSWVNVGGGGATLEGGFWVEELEAIAKYARYLDGADGPFRVVKAPKRQLDWRGHRVRATREIQNQALAIPPGRLGTVKWTSNGIVSIVFDACSCCGVAATLSWKRIHYPDLIEFVAEVEEDLLTGVE